MLSDLTLRLAVLLIALSGMALMLQQHAIAWRLFVAGCISAIAGPLIELHSGAGPAGRMATLAGWIAVAALCAALLGVRRWPIGLALSAGTVWFIVPLVAPMLQLLLPYWWVVPVAVLIPLLAAFMGMTALRSARRRIYARNPKSGMSRFAARLLNQTSRARSPKRKRARHISDIGVTKRGRSGRGPRAI